MVSQHHNIVPVAKHSVKNNKTRRNSTNKNKRKKEEPKNNKKTDNHDKNEEPKGKRRKVEKKPMDMPRRALSAYNIFFSEQRKLILEAIDSKEQEKDNEKNEEDNASVTSSSSSDSTTEPMKLPKKIRQPDGIPCVSSHRVSSLKRTKRLHRKVHGKINLVVLAREVSKRWKELSDEDRKYYNDLAAEDKIRHTQAMKEYKERKALKAVMMINQQKHHPQPSTVQLESTYSQMTPIHHFQLKQQRQYHLQNATLMQHQMFAKCIGAQDIEFQGPFFSKATNNSSALRQRQRVLSALGACQSNVMPLTNLELMMIMRCRAEVASAGTKG